MKYVRLQVYSKFNWQFPISQIGFHAKVKEPNNSYYVPIA